MERHLDEPMELENEVEKDREKEDDEKGPGPQEEEKQDQGMGAAGGAEELPKAVGRAPMVPQRFFGPPTPCPSQAHEVPGGEEAEEGREQESRRRFQEEVEREVEARLRAEAEEEEDQLYEEENTNPPLGDVGRFEVEEEDGRDIEEVLSESGIGEEEEDHEEGEGHQQEEAGEEDWTTACYKRKKRLQAELGDTELGAFEAQSIFLIRLRSGQNYAVVLERISALVDQMEKSLQSVPIFTLAAITPTVCRQFEDLDPTANIYLRTWAKQRPFTLLAALGYETGQEYEEEAAGFSLTPVRRTKYEDALKRFEKREREGQGPRPGLLIAGISPLELADDPYHDYLKAIEKGQVQPAYVSTLHPPTFRTCRAEINRAMVNYEQTHTQRQMVTNWLLLGKNRTGKSTYATKIIGKGGRLPACFARNAPFQHWSKHHKLYIYDEFEDFATGKDSAESPYSVALFKEITSSATRVRFNIKYGDKLFNPAHVIVCSNRDPEVDWTLTPQQRAEVMSRFHWILYFEIDADGEHIIKVKEGEGVARDKFRHKNRPQEGPWTAQLEYYQEVERKRCQKNIQVEKTAELFASPGIDTSPEAVGQEEEQEAPTGHNTPSTSQAPEAVRAAPTNLTPLFKQMLADSEQPRDLRRRAEDQLEEAVGAAKKQRMATVKEEVPDEAFAPINEKSRNCGHEEHHFEEVPVESKFFPGRRYAELKSLGRVKESLKVGEQLLVLGKNKHGKVNWREGRVEAKGKCGGTQIEYARRRQDGGIEWCKDKKRYGSVPSCSHPAVWVMLPEEES